jgi:hypothetical protein
VGAGEGGGVGAGVGSGVGGPAHLNQFHNRNDEVRALI